MAFKRIRSQDGHYCELTMLFNGQFEVELYNVDDEYILTLPVKYDVQDDAECDVETALARFTSDEEVICPNCHCTGEDVNQPDGECNQCNYGRP